MKTRLCAAGVVAVLASVACSPTAPEPGIQVPLVRLQIGPGPSPLNSGFHEPAQLVIRDRAAWIEAWDLVPAIEPAPEIDFTQDMILIVAMGGRATGGYRILLDTARVKDGHMLVEGRAISPGPTCFVSAGTTQPIDVARVRRVSGTVHFNIREFVTNCG
jgi:hypothetical protein